MPLYNPSAPIDATYITQSANGVLSAEYVLTAGSNITLTPGAGTLTVAAAGGGSSLPVADTQTIVMGSADNTKLLRFEVDGFTAGATRVMTPPNANATIAGLEVANVFTAVQEIATGATVNALSLTTSIPTDDDYVAFRLVNSAIKRTELYGTGVQTWWLNNTVAESGIIAYATPGGNPGIVFFNSSVTGRSQILQTSSTGGIGLAAGTGSGNPATTLYVATSDRVGITTNNPQTKLHVLISDSATDSITNVVTFGHNAGTISDGFGTGLLFTAGTSVTDDRQQGRLMWEWIDATEASRAAGGYLSAYYTSTERFCIRWGANSTNPLIGFYDTAPIAKQTVTGSRGGNAALADLLTKLATLGLVIDGSSA